MSHKLKRLADGLLDDPLRRMRVYQIAADLLEHGWSDAEALSQHPVMEKVAPQLYSALGSIKANIAEGYSRSSGKDRARLFEYALGSARESIEWYDASETVLGSETVVKRHEMLVEIRKLLVAIIPRERNRTIRPER